MSTRDPIRVAFEPVREVIAEALVRLDQGSDLEAIVNLIRARTPSDEAGRWLFAARILMNCAVGVAEGWLDVHELDEKVRDSLIANLALIMSQGIGDELTLSGSPSTGWALRLVLDEVPVPLLFVIEILEHRTRTSKRCSFRLGA